jgi:carbon-monoxide dehydrogenase large subunit
MSYLADLPLRDALEVCFVRSPYAHATIETIEGAGVTAADLGLRPLVVEGPGLTPLPWPALAQGVVRFPGEAVAAVWAADRYLAEDAAERVMVDYAPLPAEPPMELYRGGFESGDLEAAFSRADAVVERTFRTARQAPMPLETRGVVAEWNEASGRLTVRTSTQVPHLVRRGVSLALGLEETRIRVVVPEVGGGFGQKAHVFPEELVLAVLAVRLRRPLRWIEDRRESLMAGIHAHDNKVMVRCAVDSEGHILGVDAEVSADVGAYSVYPFSALLEPATAGAALFAAYAVGAIRVRTTAHSSHRCPVGAYRGVGTNTAVFATERTLDVAANQLRIDPLEIRRRNVHRVLPVTTAAGRVLDSGDYSKLLDRLEEAAGYGGLREQQAELRGRGRLVGIGLAVFNEHSGTGASDYRRRGITAVPGIDSARVRVTEAGRVVIHSSSAEAGQDHAATYRQLAVSELGVAADLVDVIEGDTDLCPPGTGAFVSRGAVGQLDSLLLALREVAEKDIQPGTDVTRTVDPEQVFPSGAHLTLVEIDPISCLPRVLRYVCVEDCGTVVNRRVVEGQVRGGIAMGIGKTLLEEMVHGQDGQILSTTLLDYLVPLAPDVPALETHHLESPTPKTLLGSKGVGEAGTVGAFGAVPNAVNDALAPLGVELNQVPCSPDRIFRLIEGQG